MIQPGLYGEKDILGAKVKVISSSGYVLFDNDKIHIVTKIEYRVTMDGKISVSFILNDINYRFKPEDLEIIELPVYNKE